MHNNKACSESSIFGQQFCAGTNKHNNVTKCSKTGTFWKGLPLLALDALDECIAHLRRQLAPVRQLVGAQYLLQLRVGDLAPLLLLLLLLHAARQLFFRQIFYLHVCLRQGNGQKLNV